MAKCERWQELIFELAKYHITEPNVNDIDGVVEAMQASGLKDVQRIDIVESIVAATTGQSRNLSAAAAAIAAMKREAKGNKKLQKLLELYEKHLWEGTLPPKEVKPKAVPPRSIKLMREFVALAKEGLNKSQAGVSANLTKIITDLELKIAAGVAEAEVAEEVAPYSKELKEQYDKIKELKAAIKDEKDATRLTEKILELDGYLGANILPPKTEQRKPSSYRIELMRGTVSQIRKEIGQSEVAKVTRITKQISDLTEKIAANDFAPPVSRADVIPSKAMQLKEVQLKRLKNRANNAIHAMKPMTRGGRSMVPGNVARALKASWDFSGVGRQGLILISKHPIKAIQNIKKMFGATFNEEKYEQIQESIMTRPNAWRYQRHKLGLTEIDGQLAAQEEVFMNKFTDLVPGIRASNRAYVSFLNLMRADAFDAIVTNKNLTDAEYDAAAYAVNIFSGRGSLGAAENSAVTFNAIFFAPKWNMSRLQMLIGAPFWMGKTKGGSNVVRKEVAKYYAAYIGSVMTVLALLELSFGDDDDFDISYDPRSGDFLKARFGNTRYDFMSGLSQMTRFGARVGGGILRRDDAVIARGKERPYDAKDAYRFFRTKLSPMVAVPFNWIAGQNVVYEEMTALKTLQDATVPMVMEDVWKVMRKEGYSEAAATAIIAGWGISVQNYPPPSRPRRN